MPTAQTPLASFTYSPEAINNFYSQTKNLPEWLQRTVFENQFGRKDDFLNSPIIQNLFDPEKQAALAKATLKTASEYQKEQMKEAYPYTLSKQISETISNAFGRANELRLRGSELGNAAALRGVDAIAQGQFAPYGSLPQFSYFS